MKQINAFCNYINYENLSYDQEKECFLDLNQKNREIIITSHLKLVLKICKKYKVLKSSLYMDLVQDGIIALIESIDGFNPSLNNRFSTYARHRIKGRAKSFIRKSSFNHHVSDKKSWEFSKIMKHLSYYEILKLNPVEKVQNILKCDRKYAQNILILLKGIKEFRPIFSNVSDIEKKQMVDIINLKKSFLPLNEKHLLEMRHDDTMSWREIGDRLNMSHEGVRKKYNRIIFKIKKSVNE